MGQGMTKRHRWHAEDGASVDCWSRHQRRDEAVEWLKRRGGGYLTDRTTGRRWYVERSGSLHGQLSLTDEVAS